MNSTSDPVEMIFSSVFVLNGTQMVRTNNGFILCNVVVNGDEQVRAISEDSLAMLGVITKDVNNDVQDVPNLVPNAFQDVPKVIKDVPSVVSNDVQDVPNVFQDVPNVVSNEVQDVPNVFQNVPNVVSNEVQDLPNVFQDVPNVVSNEVQDVPHVFQDVPNVVSNEVQDLPNVFQDAPNVVSNEVQDVPNVFQDVPNVVSNDVQEVPNIVQEVPHIVPNEDEVPYTAQSNDEIHKDLHGVFSDNEYQLATEHAQNQTLMVVSQDSTSSSHKTEALKPNEWGADDSKLLLDHYAIYMTKVGPLKTFRTKKEMWNKIARDIDSELGRPWSGVQCETRYRTIMKRKRESEKNNKTSGSSRKDVEFEAEIAKISANDDSLEPEVRRGVGKVQVNIKKVAETSKIIKKSSKKKLSPTERLISLLESKEAARERRHQEQIALLKEQFRCDLMKET